MCLLLIKNLFKWNVIFIVYLGKIFMLCGIKYLSEVLCVCMVMCVCLILMAWWLKAALVGVIYMRLSITKVARTDRNRSDAHYHHNAIYVNEHTYVYTFPSKIIIKIQ